MIQDTFVEKVVHRHSMPGAKAARIALIVLTVIVGFLFLFVNSIIFSIPFVILIIGCVVTQGGADLEFDYELTNSEIEFSKIKNKSKRKKLVSCDLKKEVLTIAPSNSGSLYQYEKTNMKKYDCTSHNKDDIDYTMIVRNETTGNMLKVLFNPDDEMLDVMKKFCRDKIHE